MIRAFAASRIVPAAGLAGCVLIAGCSSSGMRAVPTAAGPAPNGALRISSPIGSVRDARPSLSPITVPRKLALYGTGSVSKTTLVISEAAYAGPFTIGGTCAKIATLSPASGNGPTFKTSVTALSNGNCTLTVADTKGNSASIPVTDRPGGSLVVTLLVPVGVQHSKPRPPKFGPKFVSPSTQAMTVVIAGPTNLSTVSGLTSLTPGCTLTLQGLDCQF